jgi:hypothetical protein
MLAKRGEFFPFGCTMSPTAEITLAAGYDDKPDGDAQEIIKLTLEGFRAGARSGDYKAIALCVDVRVDAPDGSGKTDAIRVTLEERGGEAVKVFMSSCLIKNAGCAASPMAKYSLCSRSFRFCLTGRCPTTRWGGVAVSQANYLAAPF